MGLKAIREAREKEEKYRGDVIYDVWARGGNPDAVNYDRVSDHYYNSDFPDEAARAEMRRQQPQTWQCQYCGQIIDTPHCPCAYDEEQE